MSDESDHLPEKAYVWPGGIRLVLCRRHLREYLLEDWIVKGTVEPAPSDAACADCADEADRKRHVH